MDNTGLCAVGPGDELKIQPERPFDGEEEEAPSDINLYSFGASADHPASTSFDFEM